MEYVTLRLFVTCIIVCATTVRLGLLRQGPISTDRMGEPRGDPHYLIPPAFCSALRLILHIISLLQDLGKGVDQYLTVMK